MLNGCFVDTFQWKARSGRNHNQGVIIKLTKLLDPSLSCHFFVPIHSVYSKSANLISFPAQIHFPLHLAFLT